MLTPHSNGESVVISYGITAAKVQIILKPPKKNKKKCSEKEKKHTAKKN